MNDSPFKNAREAAEAIASAFVGENIGDGAYAEKWRAEFIPKIELALIVDGHLPTEYEVEALNGGVPADGTDPDDVDDDDPPDYGCPDEISKKFPNVDRIIASQF